VVGKVRLNKDIELLDGLPIAHIKSINALVICDVHLGYEGHMAKRGVFIPKANLKKILKELKEGIESSDADKIIIVGDIKNDFSGVQQDELNELYEIIKLCKENKIELHLIKGNHDNFIDRYKEPFKLHTYQNEMQLGDYFFFHGDKLPNLPDKKPKMLISGHEHPLIGIVNKVGRVEKLRCFLLGKYKDMEFLVLPAISYFATGSDITLHSKSNIISPLLRKIEVDKMHAIAIGYGSTIDFGTIGNLRKVNQI
jgi:uncharacterized protein